MNLDYGDCWGGKVSSGNMLEPLSELDDGTCGGGLEPLQRARSNTWPLPRPDDYVDGPPTVGGGGGSGAVACNSMLSSNKCLGPPPPPPTCAAAVAAAAAAKKNSSRRNAWGNFSYADLITQAITSSPDKRLTLSQIYEWMVQNVDYFKDKGDSNSSAGWKNSIRHNLSLHNRFMRVQNEGTGKSSWWMINPDAKPGKSVRRRAASMETSKFEKRRGRVKKKLLEMRSGLTEATPSPSSSVSEGLDMFPDSPLPSAAGFQLSPDFRPRTSSTTSSCGGRLTPIRSIDVEPDWGSSTGGAPFSTRSGYSPVQQSDLTGNSGNVNNGGNGKGGSYSPDQLAGNLEHGMKLENNWGYMNGQGPPPPYNYDGFNSGRDMSTSLHASSPFGLPQCSIHRLQNCGCAPVQCKVEQMSPGDMSPSYPQSEPSPDPLGSAQYLLNQQQPPQHNSMPRPPSSSPPLTPPQQQQQQQVVVIPSTVLPATLPTVVTTIQGGNSSVNMLTSAINSSMMPFGCDDDLVNIESLQGGFDCNVDELIKHELNMDGSLDFNFPPSGGALAAAAAAAAHAAAQHQQHQQQLNNHVGGLNHLHTGHSHHHHSHHHHHSGGTTTVLSGGDGVGVGVGAMMVNSAVPGASPQPPPAYSAASVNTPSWVH